MSKNVLSFPFDSFSSTGIIQSYYDPVLTYMISQHDFQQRIQRLNDCLQRFGSPFRQRARMFTGLAVGAILAIVLINAGVFYWIFSSSAASHGMLSKVGMIDESPHYMGTAIGVGVVSFIIMVILGVCSHRQVKATHRNFLRDLMDPSKEPQQLLNSFNTYDANKLHWQFTHEFREHRDLVVDHDLQDHHRVRTKTTVRMYTFVTVSVLGHGAATPLVPPNYPSMDQGYAYAQPPYPGPAVPTGTLVSIEK